MRKFIALSAATAFMVAAASPALACGWNKTTTADLSEEKPAQTAQTTVPTVPTPGS